MPIIEDIRARQAELYLDQNSIKDESARAGVRNQFGISLAQYPSDLGSEDSLHYIEFNINVRGKSKFDQNKRLFEVKKQPDSANLSNEQISKVATRGGAIASAILAGGLIKKFAQRVGKTGAAGTEAGSTALGVTGGAVAGLVTAEAISSSDLLKPDTSYRISDVIALYVDGPPAVKYSMNYANKELGTLAGVISGSVLDSQGALKGAGEAAAALGTSLAKLPGAFGSVDLQTALSAQSKTSLNPFKEVIFESVDFRSFAFKYKFLPRSKSESEQVKKIIKLFKFHMHPELSSGKLFFIYPSEFQITYYFEGAENQYFHKFAPCVLESMEVTYGGDTFSSFDNGDPTEINMSLTFREQEILTKDMIDRGY